ncbi:MAG: DUF2189 domain-containing protein [Parasphingorhabdus sp.]
MDTAVQAPVAKATVASNLTLGDLGAAFLAGWVDFKAHPIFGLFFASIYALAGIFLSYAFLVWGEYFWIVLAAAGFPLLAPFTAVGLYEVSRRREAGIPMSWKAVLGALRGHGDEQIMSMGVILFVAFGFWLMVAHGIFAIFMAEVGAGTGHLDFFLTGPGLAMLIVGTVVGGLMALAFYSITVISLPMLVDREVDFITAIIVSLATVRSNKFVMLAWAIFIAVTLFVAMIPIFLGLFVILPVLGHATWHLYKRAVKHPGR